MGRPRINEDHTPARLPAGTLDRIEAVLRKRERRADFIRAAIERELRRREAVSARKAATAPKWTRAHPFSGCNGKNCNPGKLEILAKKFNGAGGRRLHWSRDTNQF
jgi:hypothetical protein